MAFTNLSPGEFISKTVALDPDTVGIGKIYKINIDVIFIIGGNAKTFSVSVKAQQV